MEKHNILTKRDLLKFEDELFNDLVPLLACEGASLYFPTASETKAITYIEEEEKLLLPLKFQNSDNILAIFLARKPKKEKVLSVYESLEYIVHQILEKLMLKKALQYDNRTELYTQYMLIDRLAERIDTMRGPNLDSAELSRTSLLTRGCAGVAYLHLAHIQNIAKKYGYLFAEKCLDEIVLHCLEELPHDILLARVNTYDCAFFIEENMLDSRAELNTFLHNLALSASALSFETPVNSQKNLPRVSTSVHASYILFPQDYDNFVPSQNTEELAYQLLAKAQISAIRAKEQHKTLLPFSHILAEGGNIIEKLSHNQYIIDLGKNVGLKDTMRFSVYGEDKGKNSLLDETQKIYKGDITLIELSEEYALAEQSFIYDPSNPFQKNDTLVKLPTDYTATSTQDSSMPIEKDSLTKLYKHSDFLYLFAEYRQKHENFTLALLYFEESKEQNLPFQNILSQSLALFYEHIVNAYKLDCSENCLLSSYGQNSVLVYLPIQDNFTKDDCFLAYKKLAEEIYTNLHLEVAIGIAEHPLLNYRPSEVIENARKANECAKLLDYPKVSLCDSIALNVSADKLSTQGLYYEAVQEYQSALLLDDKNALAHSSLALALASLSRYSEAQASFLKALEITPDDASLYYNLAGVSEKLNDKEAAHAYYTKCLDSQDFAFYALLKLGQLAEEQENLQKAKESYTKALAYSTKFATPYRQLARIALEEKEPALAREYLHTALHYAPHDQKCLLLLARIYLENNEDPALAAILLAPIMNAKQKDREIWKLYVKALKLQGKNEAAAKAEQTLKNI